MLKPKNIPGSISIVLLLLMTTVGIARAQEFGGNPPSIKWKQVNTKPARVIFPAGMDSVAIRIADIIQRMNGVVLPTIGQKQRQVSIVLQDQTIISNAYVGLAPFRSEFYLTPDQNSFELGSLPWPEQLAIHEFRHVQQYNNFNVGLSKVLRVLFGEGGQAFGNDLSIPNWFFEGDAVYNETLVSRQGRGRLPFFFNSYRALWAAGKDYSWMKLRNGSYVDYIPDHYPLGYMMVAYGREKYGDDFWKNVTHDAAAFKGLFYPMQTAVKKYSGQRFSAFSNDALGYFKKEFDPLQTDRKVSSKADPEHIITQKHFDANREYPAFINDSTLIYVKTTYSKLPAFVIGTNGKERAIGTRAVTLDSYFNYNDGKAVYTNYRADPRWGYRNYNDLVVLDIKTGEQRNVTRHTRYFSPAFSGDNKKIVAVEVAPTGSSRLHIVDAANGHVLRVLPNGDKLFYTYPKFYGDDKLIAAVRNAEGKMSLAQIDISTGATKYLLPFTYQPIAFPVVKGDVVYFTATIGTNDALCKFDLKENKLYLTDNGNYNGSIGYYQPAVSDTRSVWVGFAADGYKINSGESDKLKWTEKPALPVGLPDFGLQVSTKDTLHDLLSTVPDKPQPVSKYNKAYHLFNFHSLIPDLSDPNYTVTLSGENVINTFQSQLSFNYNRNEGYKDVGFDAAYGALFPIITAGFDYTLDRRARYQGINLYWNETDLHAGLQLPLNFSKGRQLTGLTLASSVHYSNTSFQQQYQKILDQAYTYLNNTIAFNEQVQQARQNIYPRLGTSVVLNYKTAVHGLTANQLLATGTFYLPGIGANHSLLINLAHQEKGDESVISFSNNFPFSRGYTAENLNTMNKIGADYHFPIAYPDAGIANTVYFMRIRGDLFYDHTRGIYTYTNKVEVKSDFRSVGGALYFDTKWFNQQPLTFGIRYSRLLDRDVFGGNGPNFVEFVLPVSFF